MTKPRIEPTFEYRIYELACKHNELFGGVRNKLDDGPSRDELTEALEMLWESTKKLDNWCIKWACPVDEKGV